MGFRLFTSIVPAKETSEAPGSTLQTEASIVRAVFFGLLFLSAFWGLYYHIESNRPIKVLKRSAAESLKFSFHASIEGSVSIGGETLATFRSHQRYKPGQGVTILADKSGPGKLPFDARGALEALLNASSADERDREDMYSHGTRHLSGTVTVQERGGSAEYVFESWFDMRKRHAVRVIFARVDRNAGTDAKGEPVSKETYINIGYSDWR